MLTPNKRRLEDGSNQSLKKCKKVVVSHVGESSGRSYMPDPCGSVGESSDGPRELNYLISQFHSEELGNINDTSRAPLNLQLKSGINEIAADVQKSSQKEPENAVDWSALDEDVLDEMAAQTEKETSLREVLEEGVDWSELDQDLLARIAEKELPVDDFTSFSLVCRSWHRAAAACSLVNLRKKWVHNQMPWLMLPDGNTDVDEDGYSKTDFVLPHVLNEIEEWEDDLEFMSEARSGGEELYTRRVLNLRSRKSYNIKCPELYGRSCWGSAFGWIVTAGSDGKMFMFNPLTKTRVSLPSFATFRRQLPNVFEWGNEDEWGDKIRCNFFVKRAVVLNVGADDAQSYGDGVEHLRVVVFYSDHHNVAIVKPGDRRWVEIVAESEVHAPLMDVLYDKEMGLIFVDRNTGLARCNIPENHEPPLLKWIKHPKPVGPIYRNDSDYEGLYILKVDADIFMLKRILGFVKSNDERLRTKRLANRRMNIYSYKTFTSLMI